MLALSRDARKVLSLQLNKTYRVEGAEYILGAKHFINNPDFYPVKTGKGSKKVLAFAGAASFIILSTAGVLAAQQFTPDSPQTTKSTPTGESDVQSTTTIHPDAQDTAAPATEPQQPQPAAGTSVPAGNSQNSVLSAPRVVPRTNSSPTAVTPIPQPAPETHATPPPASPAHVGNQTAPVDEPAQEQPQEETPHVVTEPPQETPASETPGTENPMLPAE